MKLDLFDKTALIYTWFPFGLIILVLDYLKTEKPAATGQSG